MMSAHASSEEDSKFARIIANTARQPHVEWARSVHCDGSTAETASLRDHREAKSVCRRPQKSTPCIFYSRNSTSVIILQRDSTTPADTDKVIEALRECRVCAALHDSFSCSAHPDACMQPFRLACVSTSMSKPYTGDEAAMSKCVMEWRSTDSDMQSTEQKVASGGRA
eukprot:6211232-Pleurochrysis_carterae.AAC.3